MNMFEDLVTTIAIELRGIDAPVALNATICNIAAIIVSDFEKEERETITASVIRSIHAHIEAMEK